MPSRRSRENGQVPAASLPAITRQSFRQLRLVLCLQVTHLAIALRIPLYNPLALRVKVVKAVRIAIHRALFKGTRLVFEHHLEHHLKITFLVPVPVPAAGRAR
jgi:hypothetical protein